MTTEIIETINNNIYNFPKKLPYITVSAKGISNGLSNIINDGADFGPDTYLNSTSKNRYGPPYTLTSGIQEAINYAQSKSTTASSGNIIPEILLLEGSFIIDDSATIYINNGPNVNPSGLHIRGVSASSTSIIKQNSLPSPILSYTNTRYSSIAGTQAFNMIFENLGFHYMGSVSSITPGVTMVDLSLQETGATMNIFRNLNTGATYLPIGNFVLDVSGNEDSIINYVNIVNGSGLKAHIPGGNVNIYRSNINTMDIETQQANVIGCTVGLSVIFRPAIMGSVLNLIGTYWNGTSTNLIEISPTTNGATNMAQVNLMNALLSKSPSTNGEYMIEPNANIPTIWNFTEAILYNNNTAYTLYLFDTSVSTQDQYINLYTDSISGVSINNNGVILPTENSTSGTTTGTVIMKFVNYMNTYKKLIIYLSNYENNTTTNQTINYPKPFNTSAVISANNTGLTISTTTSGITITSPNSTTTYSGIVIIEGY